MEGSGSAPGPQPTREIRHFRSSDHPDGHKLPVVFGRFLARPLGAVMTPVMLVGLILVLQGIDPLFYVSWSFPAGFVTASAWTSYRLRTTVVEIRVSFNGAVALSAFEVSTSSRDHRLQRVFDVRGGVEAVTVTIGLAAIKLERARWPDLPEMEVYLTRARDYYL